MKYNSILIGKMGKQSKRKPTAMAQNARALPVVVLMAMSPMCATSQQTQALAQLDDNNTTELYSQLSQIEAPNALDVAQVSQKPKYNPPPRKANGELLAPTVSDPDEYINSEKFVGLDGKSYYIVYNNAGRPSLPKDEVHYIYVIPEDYNIDGNKYPESYPPRIAYFVNHDRKFIGVKIFDKPTDNDGSVRSWEIQLPQKELSKLMHLVKNIDSPYKFNGDIEFITTKSLELEQHWYWKE